MSLLAGLGFTFLLVVLGIPVELVLLEAAGLKLSQKFKVIAFLAIPKAMLWIGYVMFKGRPNSGLFTVLALAQLAASYYPMARLEVPMTPRLVTCLLLLVVGPTLMGLLGTFAVPLLLGRP